MVEKLAEVGVSQDERNLRNKLWGGKFATAFMLQCLKAIGSNTFNIEG